MAKPTRTTGRRPGPGKPGPGKPGLEPGDDVAMSFDALEAAAFDIAEPGGWPDDSGGPLPREPEGEEAKMRALIVAELRKRWPDARIVHELPLFAMRGGQKRRIDLAAITPTEIIAVEIKSGGDTLDRLEAQVRAFVPVASRVIVALAPVWNTPRPGQSPQQRAQTDGMLILHRIDEPSVEPWIVDAAAGTVTLDRGGWRPSSPWLSRMIAMLDLDELAEIARRHRLPCGRESTREDLLRDCVDHLSGREIVRATCAALRARERWVKYGASDRPIPLPEFIAGQPPRGGDATRWERPRSWWRRLIP